MVQGPDIDAYIWLRLSAARHLPSCSPSLTRTLRWMGCRWRALRLAAPGVVAVAVVAAVVAAAAAAADLASTLLADRRPATLT